MSGGNEVEELGILGRIGISLGGLVLLLAGIGLLMWAWSLDPVRLFTTDTTIDEEAPFFIIGAAGVIALVLGALMSLAGLLGSEKKPTETPATQTR